MKICSGFLFYYLNKYIQNCLIVGYVYAGGSYWLK